MRIGHGYDVHKMVKGRDCILCGVKVDYEYGPLGHSDADVPVHALIDALLGAAALGDIGKLFPDSDPQYKNVSSIALLRDVYCRINTIGYKLGNADITIIAQKPKLGPYISGMRSSLAECLGTDYNSINVKATTEEGLGFTGSCEGISAHAVVLLEKL